MQLATMHNIDRQDEFEDHELDLDAPEPDEPPEPVKDPSRPWGFVTRAERIAEMARRFEQQEKLYHPHDVITSNEIVRAEPGKVYTQGEESGLSLRQKGEDSQDWFISIWVHGIRVVKTFPITQFEEAKAYLEACRNGHLEGITEQVRWLI